MTNPAITSNSSQQLKAHAVSRANMSLSSYLDYNSPYCFLKYFCHHACSEVYKSVNAISPPSTILTLGDGYGIEGLVMSSYFPKSKVLVSDIDITALDRLHKMRSDNQQYFALDMYDKDSYPRADIICTKESLHHLDMPHKAIYNMIESTEDLIIIVEPNGESCYNIGNEVYEVSGNYKYQFTHKELVQICAAQGVYDVLVGYIPNSVYIANVMALKSVSPEKWSNSATRPSSTELIINPVREVFDYCSTYINWKEDIVSEVNRWTTEGRPADFEKSFPWVVFMASKRNTIKRAYDNRSADFPPYIRRITLKSNPYR